MVLFSQVHPPPGSAGSRCSCRSSGLPKPPVVFRPHPLPSPPVLKWYVCTDASGLVFKEWGFVDER